MNAILVGYSLRNTYKQSEWLPNVDEIASVSSCISQEPGMDVSAWRHNDYWFFDSPGLAYENLAIVEPEASPDFYDLYAFKLYPVVFEDGEMREESVQIGEIVPLSPEFPFLGYDAVSCSAGFAFECSPLSCNAIANEMSVNRFCLFTTLDDAMAAARRFSRGGYEPGPYYVLEVYRQFRD